MLSFATNGEEATTNSVKKWVWLALPMGESMGVDREMEEEKEYLKLNPRGRKFGKSTKRRSLDKLGQEYADVGLPAHKAALLGDVEALKIVFFGDETAHGVPLRDLYLSTPLHLAARCNQDQAAKWLLRYTDIDPLIQAKNGETPAHVAAWHGHADVLKVILASDSSLRERFSYKTDNNGMTPLHVAIVKIQIPCVKLLLAELPSKALGAVNASGITCGHLAASVGNVEILKLIYLKNKKYLHALAADGTAPVYFAAQEGRLDALRFLHTKAKCSLSTKNADGWSPIHAASQGGHAEVIEYLVRSLGSEIIAETTSDGATALHFASAMGHSDLVCWLVANDPTDSLVLSQDHLGHSPAHDAAAFGHPAILKVLVSRGADLHAANRDGITPYSLAIRSKNQECANFVATYIAASPKVRTRPTSDESRVSIFDFPQSDHSPEVSPYDCVDGSFHHPPSAGPLIKDKKRSKSVSTEVFQSSEGKKKLFGRKKSLPAVPYSISNPNFLDTAGSSDETDEEKREQPRRQSSTSGRLKSGASSRRDSGQASRRGSKPKPHEPQQELLEAPHDPTEKEPHYTEVASLESATSTAGPDKPPPQLSTSCLLKSLKAPQYDTVAETHQTSRKSRDQVKSIKKALKTPAIDNLNPDFEIESTEFGFRPKYSSNPLQTLGPTLATEDTENTTIGDSQGQSTDALQSTSSMLLQAALQEDQKFELYSAVDPEVIRRKRESKKYQSMKKATSFVPDEHTCEENDQDDNSDVPPPVPVPLLSTDDEEMPNEGEDQEDETTPKASASDIEPSTMVETGHLRDVTSSQELSPSFEKATKISFIPEAVSSPVSPDYQHPPQTPPERFGPQQVQSSPQLLVEEEDAESALLGAASSPTVIVTIEQNMQESQEEEANGSQSSIPAGVKSTPHLLSPKSPIAPSVPPTGSSPNLLSPGKQDAHCAVSQRLMIADTHSSPFLAVQKTTEVDGMHSSPHLLGVGKASLTPSQIGIKSTVITDKDVSDSGKTDTVTEHAQEMEEMHSVGMTIDYQHATDSSMVSPLTSPERADSDGEVIVQAEEKPAKEIWQDGHVGYDAQLSHYSQQEGSAWEQPADHPQDVSQQGSSTIQFTVTTMVDPSLLQPPVPPTHDTILEDEVNCSTSRPGSGGRPPSANIIVRRRKSSSLEDFAKIYYEQFGLKKINKTAFKSFSDPSDEVTSGANAELKEKLVTRQQYVLVIPQD